MPTYEYHCNSCQKNYDLRQGFDAESTHTCEECGKGIAKRVLVAPRVVFKGSGFYVTDSRGRSSATADTSESNGTGSADSEASTSSAASESSSTKTPKANSGAKAATSPTDSSSSTGSEAAS